MKKLLCCILALLIFIPMFVVGVNATTLEEELSEQMFDYFEGNEWDLSHHPPELPYIIIYDYVEVDDIVMFSVIATWRGVDTAPAVERIGNCVMYAGGTTYPSNVGMYARIDGEIYPIEEAWEEGLIADLSPVIGFKKYTKIFPVGDVDLDYEISILDATLIQRRVAQLGNISFRETADVDDDGDVTILDATAIQMKLAKVEETVSVE